MGVRFGKELYGNFTPAAAYFCMPQPAAATLQLQGRPSVPPPWANQAWNHFERVLDCENSSVLTIHFLVDFQTNELILLHYGSIAKSMFLSLRRGIRERIESYPAQL